MNRYIFLLTFFLGITSVNAQIHEIGVFAGASNYIGDVGSTAFVAPKDPAFGILYKWNKSPRHSYRFSYTQSTISGDDSKSDVPARVSRNLSFKNNIKEVSLGLEFNFFDFNLHDSEPKTTPYIYSGICYFAYSELFYVNGEYKNGYQAGSFGIPMTVGVKGTLTENIILGLEVGVRYTFTDNLDGSNPANEKLKILRFGNLNSNDWYTFTGLTITYTFGNKPCYCAQ